MENMKKCKECGKEKDIQEFHKNKRLKDGLSDACRCKYKEG